MPGPEGTAASVEPAGRPGARRGRDLARAGVVAVLVALTVLLVGSLPDGGASVVDRPAGGAPAQAAAPAPALPGPQTLTPSRGEHPVGIVIPSIGVHSALLPLAVDAHGVLQPPSDFRRAGWYAAGPVPGDRGPAVVAGHLDSFSGAAVFARLGQLRRGDIVLVSRSDGRTVRFAVTATVTVSKDAFPTAAVYGPTPVPTLRLITCGGRYDHAHHRYPDDVVVFAELAR
jgi:LPXTG-site transpeptidase (sortase) family protein